MLNYNGKTGKFLFYEPNVKFGIFGQFLVQIIFCVVMYQNSETNDGRIEQTDMCAKSEMNRSRGF